MDKINENRATQYIVAHYGEIRQELDQLSAHRNFAGVLQAVVNFLRFLLAKGQIDKAGKHIRVFGRLYTKGNDYLKYIIENLFIRSFEGIKRQCTTDEWNLLYKQIPVNLKKIYLQQKEEYLTKKLSL